MSISEEELTALRHRLRARQEQRKFNEECKASLRLVRNKRIEEAIPTAYVDTKEVEVDDISDMISTEEIRLQRCIAWILVLMAFGTACIILDYLRNCL